MEVFVDDETKLTLHGLQQYYCKLKDSEKNRKLFDLLDVLEFNQVLCWAWDTLLFECVLNLNLNKRISRFINTHWIFTGFLYSIETLKFGF